MLSTIIRRPHRAQEGQVMYTSRPWIASVTLLLICRQACAQETGFGHYQPPSMASESVSTSVYVPMRDGVRLAVRISRPARDGQPLPGRFAVIWQHALTITEAP